MGERQNNLLNEILEKGLEEKIREDKNFTICVIEDSVRRLAEQYNSDFNTFYKELMKALVELKSSDYKRHW